MTSSHPTALEANGTTCVECGAKHERLSNSTTTLVCHKPGCSHGSSLSALHSPQDAPPLRGARDTGADTRRLDWLEWRSNGLPIEIDGFTDLMRKEGETENPDAVFLTEYQPDFDAERCPTCMVGRSKPERLGVGHTLREAIDAAMSHSPEPTNAPRPPEKPE